MFSQTAEYALRSMSWLALTPGVLVPTGDLARATRVPAHYLAKVLQQMAAAKLITGRRGVGGGYRLARDPREITLREVVNAVTPIHRITTCPLGLASHGPNLCPLHRLMDSISASVLDVLDRKTLADLLDQPGQPTPLCETRDNGQSAVVPLSIAGLAKR